MSTPGDAILEIRNLSMTFTTYRGVSRVLEDVGFTLAKGEILGLVGETGCGKSVTARSILRLIPEPPGKITGGEILFHGEDLLKITKKRLRRIRGNHISMIFQEPMSSLNPVFTVGNQMGEVIRLHQGVGLHKAEQIAIDMLRKVNIPDPEKVVGKYPHELSGGMRQRVMIAMELSCQPELLIADEPSTALDVTVQGQVLAIIRELTRKENVSVLFITHDMGVVAQLCDRVAVMYAGKIVEIAGVGDLFSRSVHTLHQGPDPVHHRFGGRFGSAAVDSRVRAQSDRSAARLPFPSPLRGQDRYLRQARPRIEPDRTEPPGRLPRARRRRPVMMKSGTNEPPRNNKQKAPEKSAERMQGIRRGGWGKSFPPAGE